MYMNKQNNYTTTEKRFNRYVNFSLLNVLWCTAVHTVQSQSIYKTQIK